MPRLPLPPTPWLVSARLRLREFADHDAQDLVNMHHDARVRALLVDDQPLHEPHVAQAFIASLQDFYRQHEGTGIWCAERAAPPNPESVAEARAAHAEGEIDDALLALIESPTWRFIGWFSLVHLPDEPSELEIGARLLPDAWGGALALEGGEWLVARAFGGLERTRVFGHCAPANRSAARCLRALGFASVGLAPYNGHEAARFRLEQSHWVSWNKLPRRERLRRVREDAR